MKLKTVKDWFGITVAGLVIITALSTACWALVDWRIEKKQEPIVKELVWINCFLRVSLDSTQQQEAEDLYKSVTEIGNR